MDALPFHADWLQVIAEHRIPALTALFQLCTFAGEIEGYILIVALVYASYDKRLAVRLGVVTLITMSVNHALKTLIGNPRPFYRDGSYVTKWAVTPERAAELATEYSTPSGHAMAAATFYAYLAAAARSRWARIGCVVCALLIGVSRPYLGVHYVEDVLSGWFIGLLLALFIVRYEEIIAERWSGIRYPRQIVVLVGGSALLWLATRAFGGGSAQDPPSAFVSYAGLLTGILAAQPLELRFVRFDPRSGGAWRTLLRCALGVALVLGTLTLLKRAFAALAVDSSLIGHCLRYVRYTAAGGVGIFLSPWLFVRLGLANAAPAPTPASTQPDRFNAQQRAIVG